MSKLNIIVLMGGESSEHDISIKTGREILKYINRDKYNVEGMELIKNSDIFDIKDKKVDFVYLALHGSFGEDGKIQAILDTMNIKYSGTDMLSSAIAMDKDLYKKMCETNGVRVIPGMVIKEKVEYSKVKHIGSKLVLKPCDNGSSIGIYLVENEAEYNKAVEEIFKISKKIIIEKYIKGIEISVPIIQGIVYPTVRITPRKSIFFDYTEKYSDDGAIEEIYEFDDKLQNEINEMTKKAYNAIDCKAFARVDMLIEDGIPYIIEINTLPGMTSNSLLPKSLKSLGYSYSETIDLLIESSLKKE